MLHLQKQFVYLPIAFVNVTQIFVKLTFVAMIKNRQQNFLLNQQISFCSVPLAKTIPAAIYIMWYHAHSKIQAHNQEVSSHVTTFYVFNSRVSRCSRSLRGTLAMRDYPNVAPGTSLRVRTIDCLFNHCKKRFVDLTKKICYCDKDLLQ